MSGVRYLYLLHVRTVRCEYCGTAVVDASAARPQLRVAVGTQNRPIRLPALDALPTPVLMAIRCRCGRDVFYATPGDAVGLLSDQEPPLRTVGDAYVLSGA